MFRPGLQRFRDNTKVQTKQQNTRTQTKHNTHTPHKNDDETWHMEFGHRKRETNSISLGFRAVIEILDGFTVSLKYLSQCVLSPAHPLSNKNSVTLGASGSISFSVK